MFNNKIIKKSDAAIYSMPSLEDERRTKSSERVLKEAGEIQRQAYTEGFSAGEKAGLAEGEKKAALLLERLEMTIKEMTEFRDSLTEQAESQVVDLAIAIARKIIIEEISTRPEIIVSMVREGLTRLERVGRITIKINPALQELFKKMKSGLIDIHENIIFDVDPGVPVTGPLVISETEEVVTDIDSLISNITGEIKARDRNDQ